MDDGLGELSGVLLTIQIADMSRNIVHISGQSVRRELARLGFQVFADKIVKVGRHRFLSAQIEKFDEFHRVRGYRRGCH